MKTRSNFGNQYPAHWIDHGRNRPPTCSNCGSGALLNYESDYCMSDYCPHCGAPMEKDREANF